MNVFETGCIMYSMLQQEVTVHSYYFILKYYYIRHLFIINDTTIIISDIVAGERPETHIFIHPFYFISEIN